MYALEYARKRPITMTDTTPRCSNCRSYADEWTIIGGRLLCWECAENGASISLNPIPEFIDMVEMGFTAWQIFDWWMVTKEGMTEKEWAKKRDVEVQAVYEKINKVDTSLGDEQPPIRDVAVNQSQEPSTPLTNLGGIGEAIAKRLNDRGYQSVEDLAGISRPELLTVDRVSEGRADRILDEVAKRTE